METNTGTVDNEILESGQVDAVQASETMDADALSEALGIQETSDAAAAESGNEESSHTSEDRQSKEPNKALRGRMKEYERRGYNRAMQESEAKWAAERQKYEERLAHYANLELEEEAKAFAEENGIPEKFAKEYIAMKKGMQISQDETPVKTQSRAENGQFASAANDVQSRALSLMAQAEAYEKISGGEILRDDILDAFQNNSDVRNKVASGDWDFTDVGQYLQKSTGKNAPMAIRNPNGGELKPATFSKMSDADFLKFNEKLKHGAVFDARR